MEIWPGEKCQLCIHKEVTIELKSEGWVRMINREEERTFYENGVTCSLCSERKFNTYKALNPC